MTVALDTSLDVSSKYKELVERATDGNSVYVRAKEALEALWADGNIDSGVKAEVTVKIFSDLNSTVVTNAMSIALQWEAQEKQLAMAKLKLQYELDLIKAQAETQAVATDGEMAKKQLTQAQTIRVYGTHTVDSNGDIVMLNDDGQIYGQMLLTEQDVLNKAQEEKVLKANEEKVYADVHRSVADTYVNYGMYTGYSVLPTGITGASKVTSHKTLSDYQANIASIQAKGYAYNAWSNAASSAASMIGVLLSSENGTALTTSDVNLWRTSVTNLNSIPAPSI